MKRSGKNENLEQKMIENRSQQRLIVISVAFSSFMARLNNYTVNVSLPTISRDFNVGTGEASRIVMSYPLSSPAPFCYSGNWQTGWD